MTSRPHNQPQVSLSRKVDACDNIIRVHGIDGIHGIVSKSTITRRCACREIHHRARVVERIVQSDGIVRHKRRIRHSRLQSGASREILLRSWVANLCDRLIGDEPTRDGGIERLPLCA